jgi:glutamate-5-semialdehyde dehydrogenase
MADDIVLNSKTQRTSVCNAAETILFTRSAVEPHLDRILRKLADAGVFLHLCPTSLEVAQKAGIDAAKYERASEDAYGREYLALEVAIRVVDDLERAVAHIDQYGSRHTEAVVTNDYDVAQAFVEKVDSSCVMVNASTRFADGNQLGLGAEIGISTTRMHAYGPMGIKELTTTKFVVFGSGQTRT